MWILLNAVFFFIVCQSQDMKCQKPIIIINFFSFKWSRNLIRQFIDHLIWKNFHDAQPYVGLLQKCLLGSSEEISCGTCQNGWNLNAYVVQRWEFEFSKLHKLKILSSHQKKSASYPFILFLLEEKIGTLLPDEGHFWLYGKSLWWS